ncbi:MAG TPA: DUF6247 family protein [Actinomycetospora sp.]|jgi:hypothetical protein|uniref:DUF6247 family protein n=1 Tax=Actinomycetospora sp. TaxID=1872135 RepID=UPI002F42932F
MTAAARDPVPEGSLARGASPATVHGHLPEPERSRFLAEYEAALDHARGTLDLAPVLDLVERYRAIAIAQSDPEAFRRGVRRWAEIVTGEPVPDDEPFEVTRTKAGI